MNYSSDEEDPNSIKKLANSSGGKLTKKSLE